MNEISNEVLKCPRCDRKMDEGYAIANALWWDKEMHKNGKEEVSDRLNLWDFKRTSCVPLLEVQHCSSGLSKEGIGHE